MTKADLLADGTKRFFLSKQQFEEVNKLLRALYLKTKCGAVMLADTSGLMIGHAGTIDESSKTILSSLAAGNHAATNEMARLVNESSGFKVSFLEGEKNSLYVTGVDDSFLLVVVFGESTTFGMLRVLVQKLIEQLQTIFAQPMEQASVEVVKREVESAGFQEELSSRLDSVLFGK